MFFPPIRGAEISETDENTDCIYISYTYIYTVYYNIKRLYIVLSNTHTGTYIIIYIYIVCNIYIYIYMCVRACLFFKGLIDI